MAKSQPVGAHDPAARTTPLPGVRAVEPPVPAKPFDPDDPRALQLVQGLIPADAFPALGSRAVHLLGVPFDASVSGRRGCADGPRGIREAFRYATTYDVERDVELASLEVVDHGDVVVDQADTRTTHARAADAVGAIVASGGVPFVMGGDHSLTYAHIAGLAEAVEGRIGIVVIDAHYDLRQPKDGHISSGTPFWRILNELPGTAGGSVAGRDIVEIGIRPFANSAHLAQVARDHGVVVHTASQVRRDGIEAVTEATLEHLEGVDHLWLSIDMDGVDQSHAPGVSAPSPGGLMPHELDHVAFEVARHAAFAGLDVLETAPPLDPTGNTARVAALSMLHALAGHASRA